MRIVVCWADVAGYMAACWRELAKVPGVDLRVIAFAPGLMQGHSPLDDLVTQGLPCRLLGETERERPEPVHPYVIDHQPDVVVMSGWFHRPYTSLVNQPSLRNTRFVMTMDNPWRDDLRQRLAAHRLRSLIRRVDRMVVASERAWQFARHLGFEEQRIQRGMYGIDDQAFAACMSQRLNKFSAWPRQFLFTGRYVRTKGLDVLINAYEQYRGMVREPWGLTCCGTGPLGKQLADQPGVTDAGFVQPRDLPDIFAKHGVFVLPSRFEPWGAVIAEAAAAGMPVICTESCGAAVDLVHHLFNGYRVPGEDANALAQAMKFMHDHADELPTMGRRSRHFAEPYGAAMWARRWHHMCCELTGEMPTPKVKTQSTAPRILTRKPVAAVASSSTGRSDIVMPGVGSIGRL